MNHYRFTFAVTQPFYADTFLGSRWRSILMKAMYRSVCFNKKAKYCSDCVAFKSCGYPYYFDNPSQHENGFQDRPHPYVIQTDSFTPRQYCLGETITFNLTLFGKAPSYLPFLIYSLNTVRLGKTDNKQNNLALQSVEQYQNASETIVIWKDGLLTTQDFQTIPESNMADCVHMQFYAPLRLINNNRLVRDFNTEALGEAMNRKIALYDRFYNIGKVTKTITQKLNVKYHNLVWQDWKRYSNRQKKMVPMGGLIGNVVIETEAQEVKKALSLLSYIGIGKANTMGLGQYSLVSEPGTEKELERKENGCYSR